MLKRLKTVLRRFREEDEGTMLIEAVIILPTLFAALLATYVFFDAYRNQSINLKAAYTISDAVSRETETIDNTYVLNAWRMHSFLTNSRMVSKLRISVIQYVVEEDEVDGNFYVVWSKAEGGAEDLTDATLAAMDADDRIPVLPNDEVLIVVETWVDHEPIFSIGLEGFTFSDTVFTRPRFAPGQLCFSPNGTFSGRICRIES